MIDFPTSPTRGQTISTAAGSYVWDGSAWVFPENRVFPPVSTLTDTFSGPTLDPVKWNYVYQATIEAGRVKLPMNWNYSGFRTPYEYTLKGSSLFAKVTPPASSRSGTEVEMMVSNSTPYRLVSMEYFYLSGGMQLGTRWYLDGREYGTPLLPYNPTSMAWWKISESNGIISFAYGPDGVNWTTLDKAQIDLGSKGVRVTFDAGDYNVEIATDYTYIDNINIVP